MQVAGSITVQNTGPYAIRPGQKVCWCVFCTPAMSLFSRHSYRDVPAVQIGANGRVGLKRTRANVRGQPPNKDMFQTVPLEELVGNTVADVTSANIKPDTDIITQLHTAHPHVNPPGAGTNKTIAKILSDAYEAMIAAPHQAAPAILYGRLLAAYIGEATNRVIGIALSGAAPGQQFDILLQAS